MLRSLPQASEQPQPRIAIRRFDAEFALVIAHRNGRGIADAAIGAAGVEAERGEPALDFLDLGKRRRRLAAGKLLNKRRPAKTAIAQIDESKGVTHRRIIAARGEEILAE